MFLNYYGIFTANGGVCSKTAHKTFEPEDLTLLKYKNISGWVYPPLLNHLGLDVAAED
jgi:hypothetical protein